jgi:hypothetical protein
MGDRVGHPFEMPQRSDITAMLSLAVPVVVAQVGMMLLRIAHRLARPVARVRVD